MVDFEYYNTIYGGELDETTFGKLVVKADDVIKELIGYKEAETEFQIGRINQATCYQVDLINELNVNVSKGNIKSYSLGDLSVSLADPVIDSIKNEYLERINGILESAGFKYRGLI